MFTRRLTGILFTVLLVGPSAWPEHPNVAKGFHADKLYQFNGVDNVNLYNGNLSLTIPIGQRYGGNGNLTYGLTLSYNNKAWDQEIVTYRTGCTGNSETDDPNCYKAYIRTMPSRRSNSGMGWLLSLGRLIDPADPIVDPGGSGRGKLGWTYESPDGADHTFLLHDSDGTQYTSDGSFLRMKESGTERYEVHFPDGMVHAFVKTADAYSPRLYEIVDPFRNRVVVTYAENGDWTLTEYDANGAVVRTHYVRFADTTMMPGQPAPADAPANYDFAVREIDLAAFGGQRAIYSLEYTVDQIVYGCGGDPRGEETPNPRVPRLRKVSLPDGSAWTFGYHDGDCASVQSMTLPTLGKIEWTYAKWLMPVSQCRETLVPGMSPGDDPFSGSEGVATKTVTVPGAEVAIWAYTQRSELQSGSFHGCAGGYGARKPQQSRVTVNAPDGTCAQHYFSVFPHSSESGVSGFDVSEYGLPFTRAKAADDPAACDLAVAGALCLSTESGITEGDRECGNIKRRTYVRYEGDTRDVDDSTEQYRREVERRTVDDGGNFVQTRRSDYDGLGHFRVATTWGSWGDLTKIERTNYNVSTATVTVEHATWKNSPSTRPAAAAAWLLARFDEKSASYAGGDGAPRSGSMHKSEYAFDSATGALQRTRVLKNLDGAQSTNDLITAYTRDALGNVTRESFYGGDRQTVPTGALGSLTLPETPEYRLAHGYQHGTRSQSAYLSGSGAEKLRLFSAMIDQNTGAIDVETDPAGVQTDYGYDSSARLVSVVPQGRTATTYVYAAATPTANASATETVRSQTGAELTQRAFEFDGLGRIVRERTSMPAGQQSRRDITYDSVGRKKTVSELGSAASLPYTQFEYDALGRTRKIVAPDRSETEVAYVGERLRRQTTSLAMPSSAAAKVERTEEYDPFGRLVAVTEPSGPTSVTASHGANVTTRYGYNAADHLTSVKMTGAERVVQQAEAVVQHRDFHYDGRGFLTWESHPESSMSSYTYDSRGHVLATLRGAANSHFDLEYTYDEAERLTHVHARNPKHDAANPSQPKFRPLKVFTFATENVVSSVPQDRRAGKLLTATRYNYPLPEYDGLTYHTEHHLVGIFRVDETYAYKDAAGRRTDRKTSISRASSLTSGWETVREISTAFAYDDLDLPVSVNYPMCQSCGVPTEWQRSLAATYDRGRVTTVPGFVDNAITYWPNGMRKEMVHSNGIVDAQAIDATTMMQRPLSMKSALYDSCTAPVITQQPVGGRVTSETPSVQMSVVASGTGPLEYQWWASGSGDIPGATGSAYTASPTTTTQYAVIVRNRCRSVLSNTVTVSVGTDCSAPYVVTREPKRSSAGDQMWTLEATAGGAAPLSVAWYRASDDAKVGDGYSVTVGPITRTTSYYVKVTHECSTAEARASATVEVPLPMTGDGLVATANVGTNTISVTWPASSGASRYRLERRSGAAWEFQSEVASAAYSDTNVTAGRTYAYRVQAVDDDGRSASLYSNSDVATLISFSTVVEKQTVSARDFDEMLRAVNAVRLAVGWPALTWDDIIAPTQPLPHPGRAIHASHVTSCRARMNEALQALGARTAGHDDPDLQGMPVRAIHLQQVQGRAQ